MTKNFSRPAPPQLQGAHLPALGHGSGVRGQHITPTSTVRTARPGSGGNIKRRMTLSWSLWGSIACVIAWSGGGEIGDPDGERLARVRPASGRSVGRHEVAAATSEDFPTADGEGNSGHFRLCLVRIFWLKAKVIVDVGAFLMDKFHDFQF